jgi:hypothetical protein
VTYDEKDFAELTTTDPWRMRLHRTGTRRSEWHGWRSVVHGAHCRQAKFAIRG